MTMTGFRWKSAVLGRATPAVLLVLLAACDSRVVPSEVMPAYSQAETSYGLGNRDARVVIHGDPFGVPGPVLGKAVTDAMRNRVMGVVTNFTTTPNDTAHPDYRVAFVFNPVRALLSSSVCGPGPFETKPPQPDIEVLGAFCRGGGALTSATGWLDGAKGPGDSSFRTLMGDMTSALFPTTVSDSRDSCSGADC